MGAVLEMRMRALFTGLALALLAGCGSDLNMVRYFADLGAEVADLGKPQQDVRGQITPQMVAAAGRPVLFATLPQRGTQVVFVEDTRNGDSTSWLSPSNEAIVLQDGVLIATRAAGGDLISADVRDVRAALAGASGPAERIHRYLDGENHLVVHAYICDYSRAPDVAAAYFGQLEVTRVDERCTGPQESFENRYWIAGSGDIVRSEQWVGPAVGHLTYERLSNWADY